MLLGAVPQVWMDITARVRAALADLEAQSPPNNSQLRPGDTWRRMRELQMNGAACMPGMIWAKYV